MTEKQPQGQERRRQERYKTAITSLCIKRSENTKNLEMDIVPIKNMALGGAFIQTEVPYKVGTVIDLQFIVPDYTKPITIKGKIAWVSTELNAPGMGIEFISIPDQDKNALALYFNSLKK